MRSNRSHFRRLVLLGLVATAAGCTPSYYDPERATRPFPRDLHLHTIETDDGTVEAPVAADMQVFRKDQHIEIVNTTVHSYANFDVWINMRYVKRVDRLDAGETIRLDLREFYDRWGESIRAGGFFATQTPMPVRLVQIQVDDQTPLVGLVTIRPERVDLPRPRF